MQEWGHVVRHPELFHIATVSNKTAKVIKDSGKSTQNNVTPYKVTKKNRVFIPLNGFASAHIKNGEIIFENKSGVLSERVSLVGASDFLTKLKSLTKKKLAKNEFLTVKLGANDSFHRARFSSYADLYKYVNEYFAPHLHGKDRADLMAQLSVVKVVMPQQPKYIKRKNATKKKPGKGASSN